MTMPSVDISLVSTEIGIGPHELVSIVGGGGKTTLTFAIAGQLSGRRIVTTTTKMGRDQYGSAPVLIGPTDDEISEALAAHEIVQVWGGIDDHKAIGCDPEAVDRWFTLADHVVVESDGARRRPFKSPRVFEPPVPSATTIAIAVIGTDALGRVIADRCHRPLRVAAVGQCSPWERLSPVIAARVLTSPRGSRKNIPAAARFVVVINKVRPGDGRAAELAERLNAAGQECVMVAHIT